MQIEVLLKIAGIGLMVTVIGQVLSKAGREDIATLATVAGIILVLLIAAQTPPAPWPAALRPGKPP